MVTVFWAHQDEHKVRAMREEHPEYVYALAYEAWTDSDVYRVFENMEEYEKYKAENFTSIYSGWITLDIIL